MSASTTRRQRPLPPASSPSRRLRALFILAVFLVAVVGAAVLGWRFAEASKPVTGPIVLISVDTLRADRLPAYGRTSLSTPNLDRLARASFVFERAYAHSPLTLPSHASMLTGLLPFEHGVRDDLGFALSARHATLAHLLSERGFATGASVSSYLLRSETGLARGFSTYDATRMDDGQEPPIADVTRDGAETIAAAERWLDEQQSGRFFYFVHLDEPRRVNLPAERSTSSDSYDRAIASVDTLVGRLLATLERKGLYDDALIVVTSDHGEALGDRGEQQHGLLLGESVIRVPLFIKMPGERDTYRISTPVQHIDLVPTVLDLARAPRQEHLRGRSLRLLLEEQGDQAPEPRAIYSEALSGRFQWGFADVYALTDERYRFIAAPRPELYDLRRDPGEQANLALTERATAAAMADALAKLKGDKPIGRPTPVLAAVLDRLGPLGYTSVMPTPPADPASPAPDPKDMVSIVEANRQAMQLASAGLLGEAIARLEAAAAGPEAADVWRRIGALQLRDGRPDDAMRSFERFTRSRPDRPEGSLAAARVLFDLGRLDDARREIGLALETAPADKEAMRGEIAELAIRLALLDKDAVTARRLAAEAQAAFPGLALGPYVEARLLHAQGDFEGAAPLFEKAAEVSATRGFEIGELNWYLGDTLTHLDRFQEAEKAFRRELTLAPKHLRTYASLATLYHASHREALAGKTIDALERAVPTPDGQALAARLRAAFGSH